MYPVSTASISKTSGADQVVHLAIEVTTPADPFPARRQPMLPKCYSAFL
jgi:hypothetical protein